MSYEQAELTNLLVPKQRCARREAYSRSCQVALFVASGAFHDTDTLFYRWDLRGVTGLTIVG